MSYKQYITRDPEVMLGKPIIKGTRITVELVMRKMAAGYAIADILQQYPHLKTEQVRAAFEYTADMIAREDTILHS